MCTVHFSKNNKIVLCKIFGQFLTKHQIGKCYKTSSLGQPLPCIDHEFMHETCRRLVFKKLCAMKMSPDTS